MSGSLNTIRQEPGADRAVVFLHGFSGGRDDTWDGFPTLLGTHVRDWDIYTLGYATTLLPDVVGVWSSDPDLPILASLFSTQLKIGPLDRYDSLTVIAHSMGGLVVQKALVDDVSVTSRVRNLILFGTPSNGLRKASWFRFWKRQLHNMARGSKFVTELRDAWNTRFDSNPSFDFFVVAGSKDQFVPPASSLKPFDRRFHRVVDGDHLSIVKPKSADEDSFRLVLSALVTEEQSPASAEAPLSLGAVLPKPDIHKVVSDRADTLTEKEIVDAALGLERGNDRDGAIALLERYRELGTDVQGTLAGRMKRLWIEEEDESYATRALELYGSALDQARQDGDVEQIYYHAINVAFLKFVVFDEPEEAKEMAGLAFDAANKSGESVWSVATIAEAYLYRGDKEAAVEHYRKMISLGGEAWQHASASLQAGQIATKLGDTRLLEELELIFTPSARKVNQIFVSYSHKDVEWMRRLREMMQPYLREAENELQLWVDDREIAPGARWDDEIRGALDTSGVAVALVSATFLASKYIVEKELPAILDAATHGDIRLLWVHLSHALYEETPLDEFHAAYEPSIPLEDLTHAKQNAALKDIAIKIKEASLSATGQFTK